jgi:CheY-like chemotaxis protein
MSKKILVVDDEPEDLNTMKTILEEEGYKVSTASDGLEALKFLTGNGFDLILIDIKMPSLSGYDLLRLLREKLNHKVKMAYVSIVPEKEIDMTDIDGFIQKPFSPESFLEGVKKAIGGKK